MYHDHFDGSGDLDAEDVISRAYALGVASVCGDPDHQSVYEDLKARSPDSYDESLVELAFEEGRARALELEPGTDGPSEIWETLVETRLRDVEIDPDAGSTGLPDVLTRSESESAVQRPGSLDLPSFLEK